jgi:hypothetical protein
MDTYLTTAIQNLSIDATDTDQCHHIHNETLMFPLNQSQDVCLTYSRHHDAFYITSQMRDPPKMRFDKENKGAARTVCISTSRFIELILQRIPIQINIQLIQAGKMSNYQHHIGGNIYVSLSSDYPSIDIRQFYYDSQGLQATSLGVNLHITEWDEFINSYREVTLRIPAIKHVKTCSQIHGDNYEEKFSCLECHPYFW